MEHATGYARLVRDTGTDRLWGGQSHVLEPHQVFAHLAGQGIRVPVGTAVTLLPLRHPLDAALQARSLAVLTGHPVVAGIGIGSAAFVAALHGRRYDSPTTAVREYVSVMRAVLDNERPGFDGTYFGSAATLPATEHPVVRIGLGVLRRRMAAVAGQVADVAITWLTPVDYLSDVLIPAAHAAADRHGRVPPRFVAMVAVVLDRAGRDPMRLTLATCGPHLTAPHYVEALRAAGITVDPRRPDLAAERLVAEQLVLTGSPAQIVAGIERYRAAGVAEIALSVTGVSAVYGHDAAIADLAELLAAAGGHE